MDLYVARQPIFDRSKAVAGYELLHRESERQNEYRDIDGEYATSRVITSTFLTMGLDSLTNGKLAFINFTADLLKSGVASLLPKNQLVIEILETVAPTREILEICAHLKRDGYKLALDDYVLDPAFEPLANLADIIKVDFRRASATDQFRALQMRKDLGIQFLAEKVETEEEFDRAKALGYGLFQGYFFARPVILKTNTMLASKLGYIRLMQAVSSANPDFRAIVAAIESDVKMSMETIKLSNSAYYGRRQKISSIRQAVVVLGLDGIRKWIYLASLRRLGTGKPDVLVSTSIIRAKFMEMLAEIIGQSIRSPEYSLLGLFSLLDALTNCPFEALLSSLNINDEIAGALTGANRESQMSHTLHLIQRYEQGLWKESALLAEAMGITMQQVAEAYLNSLKCYHEFISISEAG